MIVNLALVSSIDGKITRGASADISSWTSSEDKAHLTSLIKQSDLIIMGGNTYHQAKSHIDLTRPIKRVVLTRSPETFQADAVDNKLKFIDKSPVELVHELNAQNIKNCLILGGPGIFTPLFQAKLIDYIYLTIEPKLFGRGLPLLNTRINVNLRLETYRTLNQTGTLLLKYKIIKTV